MTQDWKSNKTTAIKTHIYRARKKKRKAEKVKVFNLCREHWPLIFNKYQIKPLSIGIRQELLRDAINRNLPISNRMLYNALHWLTSTVQYKESLTKGSNRHDAKGIVCGPISREDRAKALKSIDDTPEKIKKIAEIATAKEHKKNARKEIKRKHGKTSGDKGASFSPSPEKKMVKKPLHNQEKEGSLEDQPKSLIKSLIGIISGTVKK